MFRACELAVVNKIDLLEHVDVDLGRLLANLQSAHPGIEHLLTSARTGEGVEAVRERLLAPARERVAA